MTFRRLVVVDTLDITPEAEASLQSLSEEHVVLPTSDPSDVDEVLSRIGDADAALVRWAKLPSEVLQQSQLRYIGMCVSPYAVPANANVDLAAAAERDITVTALGQYGDEATAEWVIASMLNAAHHIGPIAWRERRSELFGKRLAVIGLGPMGWEVAYRAKALGMEVVYTSRSEKPHASALGFRHVRLEEALSTADVVTVHIAKGVRILDSDAFDLLRDGVMLINTSIGQVFDPGAFAQWLGRRTGVAIGDATVDPSLGEPMRTAPNAFLSDQPAADTLEMQQRKSNQLLENAQAFLAGRPIRVHPAG